jgi:hypothetical protein
MLFEPIVDTHRQAGLTPIKPPASGRPIVGRYVVSGCHLASAATQHEVTEKHHV